SWRVRNPLCAPFRRVVTRTIGPQATRSLTPVGQRPRVAHAMQVGMLLHPERGVDAVVEEARIADQQGFDSVWLFDHLIGLRGSQGPDGPMDSFVLMTAIGAVTQRTRLAWAMLNPSFDYPTVLAKRLATLDHITHGRVICTLGAGWFKEEYQAYNIPLLDDHDER